MTATTVLRSVHAWFRFWERRVLGPYRVVATGLAALVTAALLVAGGVHPLLAVGIAVPLWIALAIAQEHDQRVRLPPHPDFVAALAAAVAPRPLALTVKVAHGPTRARREGWDTLVELSADGAPSHPLARAYISVTRNGTAGWMRLDVADDAPGSPEFIEERLAERGELGLVERIQTAESPSGDADAIRTALTAAYW